ncbi:hypothetical protein COEREDRAFT_82014 [Coemansia reversa NRRL 1564]|uniref:Uncharacterized protein n=1 Tax=Coemansia reversa (strain ATCC 12441 / NRRL 1564) TaxID=763665 RepID=A0A2G5B906_COERN|nr:hypothetical protein COEREDRAFT_82014 [Coemansia reversa NRRL 1564]|eukprot:PIA15470.1 hypothetical protein COEREDRAFT_82014 [Coemansia reversa NRRL 1564]
MYFEALSSSKKKKTHDIRKTVTCLGFLHYIIKKCFELKVRRNPAPVSSANPFPDPYPILRH